MIDIVRDLDEGFQEVLENLKKRGYTQEVSKTPLVAEIKRAFNILTDKSAGKYIKTMNQLDYISDKGSVFELNFPEEESSLPSENNGGKRPHPEEHEKAPEVEKLNSAAVGGQN